MNARGRPNWPPRFSTRLITSAVTAGELFVAEIDNALVATLTLQWSDPRFWGDAPLADLLRALRAALDATKLP